MSCASIDCGFACNQTPLQITGKSDISDLSGVQIQLPTGNGNATARLWATIPGSGVLSAPSIGSGVLIQEAIQDTFTFYGISYTKLEVRLFYGQHVLFPIADVSEQCNVQYLIHNNNYTAAPLEVYCFFQDNMNNTLCLVLPIGVADGTTNAAQYISALHSTTGSPQPPPLSTLFQDLSGANSSAFNAKNMILHYTGQDIRTYSSLTTCDPTSLHSPVQYLFIMNDVNGTKKISSTISLQVYNALVQKLVGSQLINYLQLNTVIKGITSGDTYKLRFLPLNSLYITNAIGGGNSINVNSLKCYPINPKKDIKNKQIYLDENGRPTNIQCPSDAFTFFQNNGGNYCCNGTISLLTGVCSNASNPNLFCGLDNNPTDPVTGASISTCDALKQQLNATTLPTNFATSAAGIETIIAIIIALIFGAAFIFFASRSSFAQTLSDAAAAATGRTIATNAATNIIPNVIPNVVAGSTSSLWTPPGGSWWNLVPIALIIGFVLSSVLALTFIILYATKK